MKICYTLLTVCLFVMQDCQLSASDSLPPLHLGQKMLQQDQQKKIQDEQDVVTQNMATCSVHQSLKQALGLQITTEFTQEESIQLSQIFKEPALGKNKTGQQTFIDREWNSATHHEHKVIEHSNVLSPETKMELVVENFKDEDL